MLFRARRSFSFRGLYQNAAARGNPDEYVSMGFDEFIFFGSRRCKGRPRRFFADCLLKKIDFTQCSS